MSKFFNALVSEKLFVEWAEVLDWLFDDLKFSKDRNWNRGYTASFTKKIKKMKYLSDKDKRVVYGNISQDQFPNQSKKHRSKRTPYIVMTNHDSFARDLIRHIRNGIAHGKTRITKNKNELYIEIMDYSDNSKSKEKQTAFIFLPLCYIVDFCKIYSEINKSIMNTNSKDRKLTMRYK